MTDLEISQTIDSLRQQILLRAQAAFADYTKNFSEQAENFLALTAKTIQGGKCFRGLCALIGAACALAETPKYQSVTASNLLQAAVQLPHVLDLAVALEFYQASALIHDDIIDKAEMRRGLPALHKRFSNWHASAQLLGENTHFGDASAILAGDMLFSLATALLSNSAQSPEVLHGFSLMSAEVAYGQYLDLQLSHTPLELCTLPSILEVVKVKSARYSVMYPAILGVLSTRSNDDLVQFLKDTLEPAGIAFQLRDDTLGVFGDPRITGKPAGDDIREGKRTALLALTLQNADSAGRHRLQQIYELPNNERPIAETLELFHRFGTVPHERMISDLSEQATSRAAKTNTAGIRALLDYLITALTIRVT